MFPNRTDDMYDETVYCEGCGRKFEPEEDGYPYCDRCADELTGRDDA